MEHRNRKIRNIAIAVIVVIVIAFAYLALLNGRYHFIGDDSFGYRVFDKWSGKVIERDYE